MQEGKIEKMSELLFKEVSEENEQMIKADIKKQNSLTTDH
jgi:hypothetical protein